jgi:hypothetical protein
LEERQPQPYHRRFWVLWESDPQHHQLHRWIIAGRQISATEEFRPVDMHSLTTALVRRRARRATATRFTQTYESIEAAVVELQMQRQLQGASKPVREAREKCAFRRKTSNITSVREIHTYTIKSTHRPTSASRYQYKSYPNSHRVPNIFKITPVHHHQSIFSSPNFFTLPFALANPLFLRRLFRLLPHRADPLILLPFHCLILATLKINITLTQQTQCIRIDNP